MLNESEWAEGSAYEHWLSIRTWASILCPSEVPVRRWKECWFSWTTRGTGRSGRRIRGGRSKDAGVPGDGTKACCGGGLVGSGVNRAVLPQLKIVGWVKDLVARFCKEGQLLVYPYAGTLLAAKSYMMLPSRLFGGCG